MDFQRFLHTPLDCLSIMQKLDEIECNYTDSDHDEYYYDYADEFNEMSCLSADLYHDLESLIRKIDYTWHLPRRKKMELNQIIDNYETFWFNTAAALIDETDMMLLMKNEGIRDSKNEETERHKRIRAVKLLTKEQMTNLFSETFNFLLRYLKLVQAYEMLCGMVDELRYLHSFRERNGIPLLPPTAYVE